MGKTSTEVKQRWIDKTYKRIMVSLRHDSVDDRLILRFLDENKDALGGTTQIVRDALLEYIRKHYPRFGK